MTTDEYGLVPLEDKGQSLTEIMSQGWGWGDNPREVGQNLHFIKREETAGAGSSGNA